MSDIKGNSSAESDSFDSLPATAAEGNKDIDPATQNAIQKRGHPVATPNQKDMNAGFQSAAFYTSLTQWHPGIAYFQFLSDNNFPEEWSPDTRFKNCIEQHPNLYKVCYVIDIIMMCVVLIGLGVIAGFIAWKTIS
ncbi:hypothetical protein FRC0263_00376 [Corynebacterium diphtheriae]|nr:hypothetical protein FRC0263_00376 [Corynebacterium diphtheriae]